MADGIKIRSLNLTQDARRDDVLIIDKLNTVTNENITHQIVVDDFARAIVSNPANKLTELSDVVVNNVVFGHALVWDGNYWVNQPVATGEATGTFQGDAIVFETTDEPVVFEVAVGNRTEVNRFQSNIYASKVYYVDGQEAPCMILSPGRKYRFDQSHPSNVGLRLKFFATPTNTAFFGNEYEDLRLDNTVTYVGTPGEPGAYSELMFTQKYELYGQEWILVAETPRVLFYNCEKYKGDDFMGNSLANAGYIEDGFVSIGDGDGEDPGFIFPTVAKQVNELEQKVAQLQLQVDQLINE